LPWVDAGDAGGVGILGVGFCGAVCGVEDLYGGLASYGLLFDCKFVCLLSTGLTEF